jgi:hypothetical protein
MSGPGSVFRAVVEALIARGAPKCGTCGAVCLCFSPIRSADCPLHDGKTCACGAAVPPNGFYASVDVHTGRQQCTDFCPAEFSGRWQDWHRGSGCTLDDGKPRTVVGAQEIATLGYDHGSRYVSGRAESAAPPERGEKD